MKKIREKKSKGHHFRPFCSNEEERPRSISRVLLQDEHQSVWIDTRVGHWTGSTLLLPSALRWLGPCSSTSVHHLHLCRVKQNFESANTRRIVQQKDASGMACIGFHQEQASHHSGCRKLEQRSDTEQFHVLNVERTATLTASVDK